MKFLHIIQLNERNSYQLFKQLYKTYDLSEHTFLVINSRSALKNFPLFSEFNAFIYLPDGRVAKMKLIYQKMSQAQYIIFNSLLFNSNKYLIFLYLCCRHFLRKAAWIEWGGDLYNWVRNRRGIKNYFINHVNYYIRKHMQIIGVTFEADSEEVHRQFGENIPCFFTPLPFGEDRINLLQKTKPLKKGSRPVRVQIAHNSLQVNNHIAILSMLEDFCDQDIQIILPLNYGSFGIGGQYGGEAYRKSVISCAKQFFSKKAIIIFKKMDLECYLRYLWNIDIAVFRL